MTSIEEINKQIAKLTGKPIPKELKEDIRVMNSQIEKVEKKAEHEFPKKKGLAGNGGARENAGRKPLEQDEKRKSFKSLWEEFGGEEVEVRQVDKGTKEERVVKMARCKVVMDRIYTEAAKGDIAAAKEFNDRVGGKVPNKIVGDSDEAPILMQQVDINNALEKTYGETH